MKAPAGALLLPIVVEEVIPAPPTAPAATLLALVPWLP